MKNLNTKIILERFSFIFKLYFQVIVHFLQMVFLCLKELAGVFIMLVAQTLVTLFSLFTFIFVLPIAFIADLFGKNVFVGKIKEDDFIKTVGNLTLKKIIN